MHVAYFLLSILTMEESRFCHDHAVFFSCQSFGHCFCWQRALFQTCDQQQSNREIQNSCRNLYYRLLLYNTDCRFYSFFSERRFCTMRPRNLQQDVFMSQSHVGIVSKSLNVRHSVFRRDYTLIYYCTACVLSSRNKRILYCIVLYHG